VCDTVFFEKEIAPSTKAIFIGKMNQGSDEDDSGVSSRAKFNMQGNIVGTIVHKYSSSISIECTANLLRRHLANISATYASEGTAVELGFPIIPRLDAMFPFPPLTIGLRRRLFSDAPIVGNLDFTLNPKVPSVGINIIRPNVAKKGDLVTLGWSIGSDLRLFGGGPRLHGTSRVNLRQYGTALEVGLQYTLLGLIGQVTGEWESESGESGVGATVGSSAHGVFLRLNMRHLGQTLVMPIFFSSEFSGGLMILASALPTAAYVIGDYFVLRSRREKRRVARRHALLRMRDDFVSDRQREASDAVALMTEPARRITQAERDRDGLVILEASYFPLDESGDIVKDLEVDVACPLQALVQNGQLFVPGGRPKSALRGFYDPLPDCKKRLAVRYDFRGRSHYAEFQDLAPIVLPLESHLVEVRT